MDMDLSSMVPPFDVYGFSVRRIHLLSVTIELCKITNNKVKKKRIFAAVLQLLKVTFFGSVSSFRG